MRTIIIGDIHGCYRQFIGLLKKVNYKKQKDRLVLMGDLMDRGPHSYEMLQRAIAWRAENSDRFFLVRGNHEQKIIDWDRDMKTRVVWHMVGKGDTVRSFKKHGEHMESYADWIEENMPLCQTFEGFRCVHAGIKEENVEDNPLELLVHDHHWSKKNLYAGTLTILGHTPLDMPTYYDGSGEPGELLTYHEWRRLPEHGALCIDTGCVYGKKLTAMIVEDGQYYLEYVDGEQHTKGRSEKYIKYVKKAFSILR